MRRAKPGFTLMELLVGVTILAGILMISMAIFSRTTASSDKVEALRLNNQGARVVIDSMTNDFRLLYLDSSVGVKYKNPTSGAITDINTSISGFTVLNNETTALVQPTLAMVLYQPVENIYLYHEYQITKRTNGEMSVYLREGSGCTLSAGTMTCTSDSKQDLLPEGVVIDVPSDVAQKAVTYTATKPTNIAPITSGYLKISALKIKPKEYKNTPCSKLDVGTCFEVQTALNSGVLKQ